jgi:hypothetical protein
MLIYLTRRPPLWSSGQSSWLQIQRPGFDSRHYQKKKSNGSGTGCTQPREYNWGAAWLKSSGSCLENRENTAGGITLTTWHPLFAQVGNHFADKRWSLGRYSSLADSDQGVFFYLTGLATCYIGEVLPLHTCIQEEFSPNLGRNTRYTHCVCQ